jgi:hypothetical protein
MRKDRNEQTESRGEYDKMNRGGEGINKTRQNRMNKNETRERKTK